ncbi:PilZ domain-containing protein [Vulcaniibacterium gelatinicum]|uniref:PilZ domain-containing protein n=1 Tax=Vulcaniibacterium gelatinicum TaxID=2598725 RepID=UPI0011C7D612|nr:PilZ domain-containing protein [Vulcaniibacterium gelatinicum]
MKIPVERRQHPRQDVVRTVMVRPNGDRHEAYLLDISRGGARVSLPEHWVPQRGAVLRLYFEELGGGLVGLCGRVARVGMDDVGVEFDTAQEEDIRALFVGLGIES